MSRRFSISSGRGSSPGYLGSCPIENGTAEVLNSTAADGTYFLAYLIDTDGGTIAIVLCLPEEAREGHGTRLITSAESVFVK